MSHEQGFQWDAPRISLITNREPPTIHLLERIIVDSGDRSPELSHPNMESLPYILHFPSIKNYTLWSSIMAIKNGPSKGSIFHCYRTATAQHPENAGEVLEGFLLSLSFLSFFSLGFGPLNIALQKSCLRETQEEPIIREELGAGGLASPMSQTHGAWLKVFWNHQKISKKSALECHFGQSS